MSESDTHTDKNMARMQSALAIVEKRKAQAINGKSLQLQLWPDDMVGVPHVLVRNAMFGVTQYTNVDPKAVASEELIADAAGVKMWFTGRRLNQIDRDFFEAVLSMAGQLNIDRVELDDGSRWMLASAYSLLQAVGRDPDLPRNYKILNQSMLRLRSGTLRIVLNLPELPKKPGFAGRAALNLDIGGPLLLHAREGGDKGKHLLGINPLLKPLFSPGAYSLVNTRLRLSLRKDLAKWLLGFYSTHANPFSYSLAKLKTLCGSKMGRPSQWRALVDAALNELVEVGFLRSYTIDKAGNVNVVRAPKHVSRTQIKALDSQAKVTESKAADSAQPSLL